MRHYDYQRNHGCRLLVDQRWCGYHAVTMQNELVRVTVLCEKGGEIIEWLHKRTDTDVLFLSPNGLRRSEHAEMTLNDGPGAFMDRYSGGWQEILPSGGPPSNYGGIGFGQHGEVGVLPWRCEVLRDDAVEIAIKLTVRTIRTPFALEREMRMVRGEPTLYLSETLRNLSPQRMPAMWGHHPAFGGGFLDESCVFEIDRARIEVPDQQAFAAQRLAPGTRANWPHATGADGAVVDLSRMPPRDAKTADYFYLTDLARGRYRIINERKRLFVELNWDLTVMPHVWFWQVAGGGDNYPWWSQTYSMALEPFSSKVADYAHAAKTDDVVWLDPYGSRSFALSATIAAV